MATFGIGYSSRFGLVFLLIALCNAPIAHAQDQSGAVLINHLKHGGYVLLMRHASSPTVMPDDKTADPENVNHERQLDERGRNTAIAMGQALKKLEIPVGEVLSSPTYRALETVRLAKLGQAKTYPELGDGGQSMQMSAVASQGDWLRQMASKLPESGKNTIIVTHMPNIVTAFDGLASDLKDGEALIFEPHRDGSSQLVAKLKIEDWPQLANAVLH